MSHSKLIFAVLACAAFAQEPVAKFGTTVVINSGLRGDIYFLKSGTEWLPNFRKMKPKGTIYTTSLNVPPQNFLEGFPGVTKRFEWFAILYTGRLWVETPGVYRWMLTSDDGSKLWIDGRNFIGLPQVTHCPSSSSGHQGDFGLVVVGCWQRQ